MGTVVSCQSKWLIKKEFCCCQKFKEFVSEQRCNRKGGLGEYWWLEQHNRRHGDCDGIYAKNDNNIVVIMIMVR